MCNCIFKVLVFKKNFNSRISPQYSSSLELMFCLYFYPKLPSRKCNQEKQRTGGTNGTGKKRKLSINSNLPHETKTVCLELPKLTARVMKRLTNLLRRMPSRSEREFVYFEWFQSPFKVISKSRHVCHVNNLFVMGYGIFSELLQ